MAYVTTVGGDKAAKPLSEFMMQNRVAVPESATASGRPGDWAVGDDKLFLCLSADDWYAIALVPVSSAASSRKKS